MNRQELLRVAEEARESDAVTSAIVDDFAESSDGLTVKGKYIPDCVKDVINTEGAWVSMARVNRDGELEHQIFV